MTVALSTDRPDTTDDPAPEPPTFELFIDTDELRLVSDHGDSRGIHTRSHAGHGAPGDCRMDAGQMEAFVRLGASLLGLRVVRAPRR